jgi:hypothetical protein
MRKNRPVNSSAVKIEGKYFRYDDGSGSSPAGNGGGLWPLVTGPGGTDGAEMSAAFANEPSVMAFSF